jgi:hypothetical protein
MAVFPSLEKGLDFHPAVDCHEFFTGSDSRADKQFRHGIGNTDEAVALPGRPPLAGRDE